MHNYLKYHSYKRCPLPELLPGDENILIGFSLRYLAKLKVDDFGRFYGVMRTTFI